MQQESEQTLKTQYFLKNHPDKTANTCSGGLLNAGETDEVAAMPEPARISLRMPLIPRRSNVLVPNGDPLAQVERSRIKPWIDANVNT